MQNLTYIHKRILDLYAFIVIVIDSKWYFATIDSKWVQVIANLL